MWLSGQQKRPAEQSEGQTGRVTVGGGEAAVMLDCERRGLEVYAPAGYRWTPEADQRVLVIRGQGEIPCIAGVRQDSAQPRSVGISAKVVDVSGQNVTVQAGESANVAGQSVNLQAGGSAIVAGQSVNLRGEVLVNGVPLESLIAQIAVKLLGG